MERTSRRTIFEAHRLQVPWGDVYGLTWTGDELPAGDLPELIDLPPELGIAAPVGGDWVLGAADLGLSWTGVSDRSIVLSVTVTADPQGGSEWFDLTCELTDDGAFIVPAAVLAHLPPGWSGSASLVRSSHASASVADRPILGGATVAVDAQVQIAE